MNLIRPLKFNLARKKKQDELDKASQVQLGQKKEQDELHRPLTPFPSIDQRLKIERSIPLRFCFNGV